VIVSQGAWGCGHGRRCKRSWPLKFIRPFRVDRAAPAAAGHLIASTVTVLAPTPRRPARHHQLRHALRQILARGVTGFES